MDRGCRSGADWIGVSQSFHQCSRQCPGEEISIFERKMSSSARRMKTGGVTKGRYIKISVTDNGVGMDSIYWRGFSNLLHDQTERNRNRTRLGLGLRHHQNHGGNIYAFSKPGRGTTFHIYLPTTDHIRLSMRRKRKKFHRQGNHPDCGLTNRSNISVMQEMLEMLHYRVLPAGAARKHLHLYGKA